jgi:hypothetical protein
MGTSSYLVPALPGNENLRAPYMFGFDRFAGICYKKLARLVFLIFWEVLHGGKRLPAELAFILSPD